MNDRSIQYNPESSNFQPENVPQRLREIPRWVAWRPEHDKKPPVDARGRKIDPLDEKNWLTFERAVEIAPRDGGVGIVLTKGDGIGVVDLDGCLLDGGKKQAAWAAKILLACQGTYQEISPSLTGVKVFMDGCPEDMSKLARAMDTPPVPIPGRDGRTKAGHVELFGSGTYVTVTGMRLDTCAETVEAIPDEWRNLIEQVRSGAKKSGGTRGASAAGRNEALYKMACSMRAYGADEAAIRAALSAANRKGSEVHPNFKDGPLDDEEVDGIVKRALKHEAGTAGRAGSPDWLEEMNGKYAAIKNLGGRFRVIHEEYDAKLAAHRVVVRSRRDFEDAYCNRKVLVGKNANGDDVYDNLGRAWIEHPGRRTYDWVAYEPLRESPGVYNLWRGFSVEPEDGDLHLSYLDHVEQVVCANDPECYEYVVSYMARCVQAPGEVGQVAVVMRGEEGVGKGFCVEHFGRLFGRHFVRISDPSHLVGRFNAHLEACSVLFADEAFYAGDKTHESVLKTLVTEQTRMVERKGVDAQPYTNCAHLFMSSNKEWVVPAGPYARRFMVLDVSNERRGDAEYFAKIAGDLGAGGYSHLLRFLQRRDLSGFNVAKFPNTRALEYQKQRSMPPIDEWISLLIDQAELPRVITTEDVDGTQRWDRALSTSTMLGKIDTYGLYDHARRMVPALARTSDRLLSSGLKDWGCEAIRTSRGRGWRFPPLLQMRTDFEEKYGHVEWSIDVEDWQPPNADVDDDEQFPF